MTDQNKEFAKTIDIILKELTGKIHDLMLQCGALEAIQHRLFTVLLETNAPIHSQIVDEIKACLASAEAKGLSSSPAINHFRALIDEKAAKRVHLRLVPKRNVH